MYSCKGVLVTIAALTLTGCSTDSDQDSALANGAANSTMTQMLLANGKDGNWAAYGGGYDSNHHSPLDEINDRNVSKLGLAWYVDLPTAVNTHSAPLAVDGVIYYAVGHSVINAVEATTGKPLWTYDPQVANVAGEKLRMAWGIRGIGYWNGKVYTGTADGRLIAIDAKTGKPVWSVQTTQGPDDGRYITGAPLLFDGKVIIGHGGADSKPVRGYVTTYDAETGRQLWRFYTVPGDPAKGPDGAASDDVMAMAAKTWNGEWWKYGGGGTAWNAMTYDPELDRVYIGTGNGYPWNQEIRSPGGGDNLFLCSIVALDAKTGKYIWHYQINPGETWDYNAAMDIALTRLTIDGKERRVLVQAPKNGFFYVIDRDTGKLISAEAMAKVDWASRIDKTTGRPVETPQARFPNGGGSYTPAAMGLHNWMAMSLSPMTGLVYVPTHLATGGVSKKGVNPATWRPPARMLADFGYATWLAKDMVKSYSAVAKLVAWDPVAQKARWVVDQAGVGGGVASTAGNLVFQGNAEGKFVAYAADTGKKLWSFDAQTGITGQPIVFRAGGRQYVTIMVGFGGVAGYLSTRWDYRSQRRRLLTFSLDGKKQLPVTATTQKLAIVDDPGFRIDVAKVDLGDSTFAKHCVVCHGPGAVAGGNAPDLRKSSVPLDAAVFKQVVHGGALVSNGMPRFDELSDQELEGLRHFIRYRARRAKTMVN
jgi:quinohemoprotein ethanol dehydrogenase